MRKLFALAFIIIFSSCQEKTNKQVLKNGVYRAVLEVQDNEQLPFNFQVKSPQALKIFNIETTLYSSWHLCLKGILQVFSKAIISREVL